MAKKLVLMVCLFSLIGLSTAPAQEEPIGRMFKAEPVKVYIKDVVNQSGQDQITPASFKKELVDSLHERRAMKFEVVDNPAGSDIQVAAVITKYQYLEKGPIKFSPGVETMLLDAAATMTENYVEMSVDYTVTDTKTNKELWRHTISEYIKKKMTPEESIPLIYDVETRAFVWKCFGKARLRDSNEDKVL
ncbi:MAG: hypothetical protein PHN63_01530 [Candidatus Omnitrophica bacterium]|nr:hypothetical protein [Candidatus Omnitrophota bacterium]